MSLYYKDINFNCSSESFKGVNDLNNYELMFAFMPYMHSEIKSYQDKGLEKFTPMKI
jgi:hypothetical protein